VTKQRRAMVIESSSIRPQAQREESKTDGRTERPNGGSLHD
jgi:hypothetical protein